MTVMKKRKGPETTRIITEKNIPRISYLSLEQYPWLINAFSTREGGVSTGMYSSMNLAFTRGDNPEKVSENYRLFGESIGVSREQMVFSDQQHTTNVMEVNSSHGGMGIIRERNFADIDGIMTNEPGVCLVTSYADCVPACVSVCRSATAEADSYADCVSACVSVAFVKEAFSL